MAEAEELLYGDVLLLCEFLPHLLCRPRERRRNNFRVVRSTISESQVSFELKVTEAVKSESFSAPHTLKNLKARKESNCKRDRKCVWKPQSAPTKFLINAINLNKDYFVLVRTKIFSKGFSLLIE